MTRKKKTRSLKRIHSVKTGNTSKLKRAGTTDRQTSNLKTKAKTKPKSVYQKFLDENPEAIEKQQQPDMAAAKAAIEATEAAQKEALEKAKSKKTDREDSEEREPDLLSQLDNKNFNDFY